MDSFHSQKKRNNGMLFDTIKNNNTMNTNKMVSVPSRVHIFLWLLANNKTLTRDNLEMRKKLDDNRCLFCNELESVSHLFFECCVAQFIWGVITEISGKVIGTDFQSVARFWVADKKIKVLNVCSTFGRYGN
jgi:hypothetical protein